MRNSKVKGFTLVELIVVIAIIAILAAILVPSMLAYIKNARYTQADANAKNIHTAANAALAQAYVDGTLGAASSGTPTATAVFDANGAKTVSVNKQPSGTASISLYDELGGASFVGYGAFVYDSKTYSVLVGEWSKNSFTAVTTVPTATARETAGQIIGYYPAPKKTS